MINKKNKWKIFLNRKIQKGKSRKLENVAIFSLISKICSKSIILAKNRINSGPNKFRKCLVVNCLAQFCHAFQNIGIFPIFFSQFLIVLKQTFFVGNFKKRKKN